MDLFFKTFGDKNNKALIFSNSLGTNWTMWKNQIDELCDKYFIIVYDTRGHGATIKNLESDWSIGSLGNDVVSILDNLNLNKVNFCGISMGGLTGLYLAINHPDRFEKIIISNTNAKIGTEKAWLERAEFVRQNGLEEIAKNSPSRWFSSEFCVKNQGTVATYADFSILKNYIDSEGYAKCCEILAKSDLRTELQNINVPVLSIGGNLDMVTTKDDAIFLHTNIKNSKLVLLNASHLSNIEQPLEFNKALIEFLD